MGPSCKDCRRRLRTVWRVTRYSGDESCSHHMIRSVILAFRSTCSGCIRTTYLQTGRAGRHAKETERGRLTLKCCPGCADELLRFEFQRYQGRRWKTIEASSFSRAFAVAAS